MQENEINLEENTPNAFIPKRFDLDYYDETNPRSIISIGFANLKNEMVRAEVKENLAKDEISLAAEIRPSPTLNRIRASFWREYEKAQQGGRVMRATEVYAGICAKDLFLYKYLKDPKSLAYILTPPLDYMENIKEALECGFSRIREILSLPIYDCKGVPNAKVANLIMRATVYLDMRLNGGIIKRIEQNSRIDQRSLVCNITSDDDRLNLKALDKAAEGLTHDQLAQINKQILLEMKAINNKPEFSVAEEADAGIKVKELKPEPTIIGAKSEGY